MRSNLALSALVLASLFGATAIASAQTEAAQPAPAASANGSGAKMAAHHARHKMTSSHGSYSYSRASMDRSRPGGRPISRKPPGA